MRQDMSARRLARLRRKAEVEGWARENLPAIREQSAKLADCIESNIRLNWKSWHSKQAMRAGEYLLSGDRREAGIIYSRLSGITLDWGEEPKERGYNPKFRSKRVEFSVDSSDELESLWE